MAFFIPHAGCPHQCSFCDQKSITGESRRVEPGEVAAVLEDARQALRGKQKASEIAFFGGSFTAIGRDYIPKVPEALPVNRTYRYVHKPEDLLRAMTAVLARVDHRLPPPMAAFEGIVGREPYPVADKAGEILERLSRFGVTRFRALFKGNRSRSEVVATFIAVLELCKARRLRLAGTESDCTVTCTEEGGGELELTTDGEKTAD